MGQKYRDFSALRLPLVSSGICASARLALGRLLQNLLNNNAISLFYQKFELGKIISLESTLARDESKVREVEEVGGVLERLDEVPARCSM